MDKRERPTSDLDKNEQPLSDPDLNVVNGGLMLPLVGLGGPDTRKGVATRIGSMETIAVGGSQSPELG